MLSNEKDPIDIMQERENLTSEEYAVFNNAYVHFNITLFNDKLRPCLITLNNRNSRSLGFFNHDKFSSRHNPMERTDQIALNPDKFPGRTDSEILSTLVHEMVHLWQYQHGHASRGYHNAEFADKMESIGLMPSDTGKPGGKRTGGRMTQYIVPGGRFEQAAAHFLENNQLTWQSDRTPKTEKKDDSKTKFHCDGCELNAWARATAVLVCGECGVIMPKADRTVETK